LRLVLAHLIFAEKLGISTATFYKWRVKYGEMEVSMMSRMNELARVHQFMGQAC